jgi:DNA-binding NarL/FixJ family response regulator
VIIRVVILEDQKDTRDMLAELINGIDGFTCLATYETGEQAITSIPAIKPDVALIDIHLPGLSGTDTVRKLKDVCPNVQFIMCTSLEDPDNIFNALQAGATGYITKSTAPEKILEAITDAVNGGSPMSSQIARKVISFFQSPVQYKSPEIDKLSTREQEILQYLSKGFRYKEIAASLHVSIETVRKHIHNIYEKLEVSSRTDALNKAYPKE